MLRIRLHYKQKTIHKSSLSIIVERGSESKLPLPITREFLGYTTALSVLMVAVSQLARFAGV